MPVNRTTLDTNVLLRLLIRDIPEQFARAQRLLTTAGGRFLVPDYVFVELAFALERHYSFTRQQIGETFTKIMNIDVIDCHRARLANATTYWQDHPKLSFEDCLIAEYAQSHDATPLWTFDRKLANQHPSAQEVPNL